MPSQRECAIKAISGSRVGHLVLPLRELRERYARPEERRYVTPFAQELSLRTLSPEDKVLVHRAVKLFVEEIGQNDVPKPDRFFDALRDSGTQRLFRGKYVMVTLHLEGTMVGAATALAWDSIGTAMGTFIAVDKRFAGKGLGSILAADAAIETFAACPDPSKIRYKFGELEARPETIVPLVKLFGAENVFAMDLPYPQPPMHEGATFPALVPVLVLFDRAQDPSKGVSKGEAGSMLATVQHVVYGTTSYLDKALAFANDTIRLLPLATQAQQEEAIQKARDAQGMFSEPGFFQK